MLLSASSGGAGIDAALPHTPLGYEQNDMQQPLLSAKNKDDLQPGGTGGQSHAMLLSASSGGAGIDAALPRPSQGDEKKDMHPLVRSTENQGDWHPPVPPCTPQLRPPQQEAEVADLGGDFEDSDSDSCSAETGPEGSGKRKGGGDGGGGERGGTAERVTVAGWGQTHWDERMRRGHRCRFSTITVHNGNRVWLHGSHRTDREV